LEDVIVGAPGGDRHPRSPSLLLVGTLGFRFAADSMLEERGFEPSVPVKSGNVVDTIIRLTAPAQFAVERRIGIRDSVAHAA
jgi:hypothetical protein